MLPIFLTENSLKIVFHEHTIKYDSNNLSYVIISMEKSQMKFANAVKK